MSATETKPLGKRTPRPDVDPREAGRVGGIASGVARRRKAEPRYWGDVLMDAVAENPERVVRSLLASKNGAALAKALEFVRDLENGKLQRLRDVERETRRLDNFCCQLMDDVAAEQGRRDQLRAEVDEFAKQRRELSARLETDGGVDEWLRELGEERVEASLSRLGWLDDEGDGDALAQTT